MEEARKHTGEVSGYQGGKYEDDCPVGCYAI
jgi:hypothetical protein